MGPILFGILFISLPACLVIFLINKYQERISKELSRGIINKHKLKNNKLWNKNVIVEYNPPKGVTPLEVGYLYDMEIGKADVVCLIYKRAENGNVSLSYDNEGGLTVSKKIPISDYDSPRYEVNFWNTFFDMGNSVEFTDEELYESLLELKNGVKNYCIKKGRILKNDVYFSIEDFIKTIIPWEVPGRKISYIPYGRLFGFFSGIIMMLIGFGLVIKFLITQGQLSLGDILLFVGLPLAGLRISFSFAIGIGETANKYVIETTEEGRKIISKIYGYKKFLESCEESQLKEFMDKDPLYLDKVLPYAVALGLENIVSKKLPKDLYFEEGKLADILHFEKVI